MKQILTLLFFRGKQCYRYLREIGFGILAVAIFVLTGILFNALQSVLTMPSVSASWLAVVMLMLVEVKRKDTLFLLSIFNSIKEFRRYKIVENVVIVSPIIAFQLFFFQWDVIVLILGCCCAMAFLPFHRISITNAERKIDLNFIPLTRFEIKFYIEKRIGLFIFITILLFLGVVHISFWIIGMLFLFMTPVEIYTPQESREMIFYKLGYVRNKIFDALQFFLLFIIIPTLSTWIANPSNGLIILYGIIALVLSISLAISKKYSSYFGVQILSSSATSTMILTAVMLVPGGLFITLAAFIYYYLKAEKHMKNLYANH
ncbi:MAG: hypothetical protein AAGA77_13235 [Bacteroidota bacterium]